MRSAEQTRQTAQVSSVNTVEASGYWREAVFVTARLVGKTLFAPVSRDRAEFRRWTWMALESLAVAWAILVALAAALPPCGTVSPATKKAVTGSCSGAACSYRAAIEIEVLGRSPETETSGPVVMVMVVGGDGSWVSLVSPLSML